MEKYSESVKDAQEKLEQAEKKATDVSVGLGGLKGTPGVVKKGERDPGLSSTQNRQVSSL